MAMRMRKGPPPYVGIGPPEWLIRPWQCVQIFARNVTNCMLNNEMYTLPSGFVELYLKMTKVC